MRNSSQRRRFDASRGAGLTAPTTAIEFRLPDTVCSIDLTVPDEKLSASIVGRGDEVLRTEAAGTSTAVKVEAGGGTFSLRFGTQVPTVDNKPVLEAETQIVVDWQQGDNAPLAKLSTQIRNLRGELLGCRSLSLNHWNCFNNPKFEVMVLST